MKYMIIFLCGYGACIHGLQELPETTKNILTHLYQHHQQMHAGLDRPSTTFYSRASEIEGLKITCQPSQDPVQINVMVFDQAPASALQRDLLSLATEKLLPQALAEEEDDSRRTFCQQMVLCCFNWGSLTYRRQQEKIPLSTLKLHVDDHTYLMVPKSQGAVPVYHFVTEIDKEVLDAFQPEPSVIPVASLPEQAKQLPLPALPLRSDDGFVMVDVEED